MLEVVHRRPDVHEAAVLVATTRQGRVLGQSIQREIHLRRRALESEPRDGLDEVGRQFAWVDELQEGATWVERAHDGVRVVLGTVLEGDADRLAVACDDLRDGRLEDDLGPEPCAARARTWVKPPLPPLWKAQAPNSPSCSPSE